MTATGGSFHSNGKVLVLKLAESATTLSILKRRASRCSARVGLLRNLRCGVLGIFYFSGSNSNSMTRSEEHTSELQSRLHLVCRLLLEKKNTVKSLLNMSGVEMPHNNSPHATAA